jgi:hypothetical protein
MTENGTENIYQKLFNDCIDEIIALHKERNDLENKLAICEGLRRMR